MRIIFYFSMTYKYLYLLYLICKYRDFSGEFCIFLVFLYDRHARDGLILAN